MLGGFQQPSMHLPFQHYSLIYLDNDGKIKVQESQSIQDQNNTVFSPDVRQRFLEVLGSRIGYVRPTLSSKCSYAAAADVARVLKERAPRTRKLEMATAR